MMKNLLLAAALVSLALATGCAKGGNGVVPPPIQVQVTAPAGTNPADIYPTQTFKVTATVTPSGTPPAVTWSLTGPGTLTPITPATVPATATYVAPATAGGTPTITATLASDTSKTGTLPLTIADITTDISPSSLSIGAGLTQQFTAVAVPDSAPQTFTWACTASGVACKNFTQDAKTSGLAYYTAQDSCGGACVQITAAAALDPNGCAPNPKNCTLAKATLVASRISGTYAFQFSGYDSAGKPTALVGTFTASNIGNITSGLADELSNSGWTQHAITGGVYAPTGTDANNSNNAGLLTLTGVTPNTFQVALDGGGDVAMIEADGNGTGSGTGQKSSSSGLFSGNQTFAFGFTGVDLLGKRIGMAGLLPMNGTNVVNGQLDVNDGGSTTTICSSPCALTGSYVAIASQAWHMTLTAGTTTLDFDFFEAGGNTNKASPLTFYAVATPATGLTHPVANVSGSMMLQDSTQTYNIAAFKSVSVSALSGASGSNSNVALVLGSADGNGNYSGQFDQNDAGTVIAAAQFPPSGTSNYTYAAEASSLGRYTFNLLGNPGANPVVPPIPFVLYASGANRGFLLDQNSASVMTGAMNPQGKGGGSFTNSELPGTYAAATTMGASANADQIVANLLLTSPGNQVFNLTGTEYLPQTALTGTYGFTTGAAGIGVGTINLTAPAKQQFVIYTQDSTGCTNTSPVCQILDFLMFDNDKTNPHPSIIFAQQ